MKKVLLSLLAVAALVLSCQNYDDEFAALNTKIASLESQITSLAELRTAVTGVQSSISSLQTAVAAAQAAAEAADNADAISALATSVAAIAADLVDLQTAIDGATTEADLDALKDELNTTLAALQALIETNSDSIASLIANDADLKDALDELGVDVDSVLASNATFEGDLTITNSAELAYAKSLGNKVATIKGNVYVLVDEDTHASGGTGTGLTADEVNTITSQITYVVGNVKIDSDATVDLSKLTSVTGDYIVLTKDVSDDALVSVGGDVHFEYDGAYTSNIQTADNIFLVIKKFEKATSAKQAVVGTTSIDFTALTKATSLQSVVPNSGHTSGASLAYNSDNVTNALDVSVGANTGTVTNVTSSIKIGQAPVVSVTGGVALETLELHYAADYDSKTNPNGSTKLASLAITAPYSKLTSMTVKAVTIDGAVSVNVMKGTDTSNSATLDLSATKSIAGKLDSDANTNTLTALETVTGLSLSEQKTVALPALVSSKGTATTSAIILTEATSLSAPKLKYVGTLDKATTTAYDPVRGPITADKVEGAIALPALEMAGDLSFATATSIVAAKADIADIDLAATATSIELSSVSTIADKGAITALKLHAQRSTIDTEVDDMDDLETLTFKGYGKSTEAASVDLRITSANAALKSLVVGGRINELDVQTVAGSTTGTALASIVTESDAVIHDVHVEGNFDLTTLTLGHKEDNYAATAPIIEVIDNVKLGGVTTNVTMISRLVVTDNHSLTTLDASSIVKLPTNYGSTTNTVVQITGNYSKGTTLKTDLVATAAKTDTYANASGLKGTFQAETGGVARSFGQSQLATLKPLFALLAAQMNPATGSTGVRSDFTINLEYLYVESGNTTTTVLDMDGVYDASNDEAFVPSVDEVSITAGTDATTTTAALASFFAELARLN